MKYIITYNNGAMQWANEVDHKAMVSLLSAGVVVSVTDIDNKKALIMNNSPEGKKIGWAEIPKFADHDVSVITEASEKAE